LYIISNEGAPGSSDATANMVNAWVPKIRQLVSYNLINKSDFFGRRRRRNGNVPALTHLPLNSIFSHFFNGQFNHLTITAVHCTHLLSIMM
jgi:hypothetical protein